MSSRRVARDLDQKTEFARWFTDHRLDLGSQETVAEMIGVKRVTLQRWEAGSNRPSAEHIAGIARVFKVSKEEVDQRVGYVGPSEVSTFSLNLAQLIESKTAGMDEKQLQSLTRGLDSLLTAMSPTPAG